MNCRILPHESRPGPANMALDQALLDAVDADPTSAVLRTYEWSEPTLSLGYFQGLGDAVAELRWRDVPIVRRPSGRGALWHHREVTYALVMPRSHPLAIRPSQLYRAVHAAIVEVLRCHAVPATVRGPTPEGDGRSRPYLCFLDRDPYDILIGNSKIVGSAQRRRPSAVLQHGSLLLAASPLTPELPGLAELADRELLSDMGWAEVLSRGIPAALNLESHPERLTAAIESRARDLENLTYGSRDWTARR